MTTTLTLLSPAKLNLFLHITGQRADGYHDLQTVFRLLDWGDTLSFTANHTGAITVQGCPADIKHADNLIVRAAQLLQQGGHGVHIEVTKRIPTGGGLGGGSSNAATTLLALNQLWELALDTAKLQRLAATLGADVPVFTAGRTAWAEGVGEILTPMELPESWYLVIAPDCHVSTNEIFSHPQLTRNASPIKMAAFLEGCARNDCQQLVASLYPQVDKALNWLNKFSASKLTGTGACVFASFPNEEAARSVLGQLPSQWTGFIARGLNESPVTAVLV